jgi:hypothetical protein
MPVAMVKLARQASSFAQVPGDGAGQAGGCYRPRYLNIQRLNYLWTIRHSSARIAGNLIT